MLLPPDSTNIEQRSLLSKTLSEAQTSQPQFIFGTPWEVPVPRNVIFAFIFDLFNREKEGILTLLFPEIT